MKLWQLMTQVTSLWLAIPLALALLSPLLVRPGCSTSLQISSRVNNDAVPSPRAWRPARQECCAAFLMAVKVHSISQIEIGAWFYIGRYYTKDEEWYENIWETGSFARQFPEAIYSVSCDKLIKIYAYMYEGMWAKWHWFLNCFRALWIWSSDVLGVFLLEKKWIANYIIHEFLLIEWWHDFVFHIFQKVWDFDDTRKKIWSIMCDEWCE